MFKSFTPAEIEIVRRAMYIAEGTLDTDGNHDQADVVYTLCMKVTQAMKAYEDDQRELEILDGACDFWMQEAIDRGYEE